MLHVALLLLSISAAQDAPTLKGGLKDIPAKGAEKPYILLEGTTNLPDGAVLNTLLYYGGRAVEGKEIFRHFATVKGGKFTQDFTLYPKKNLPGKYIARIVFNPGLQGLAVGELPEARVDIPFQLGTQEDFDRESKAVRDQLIGEIRFLTGLGEQVKVKIKELQGKPAADWDPLITQWRAQVIELQRRTLPREVPEYKVLGLDTVADPGMENLCSIFLSAAFNASKGRGDSAHEGFTRLNQTAVYWISEIGVQKLTEPAQIQALIENARKVLREALENTNKPVLLTRRKFTEMNALLDKSVPADFHVAVLDIESRAVNFLNALADKQDNAKDLHAEVDRALDRFASALRSIK